MPCRSAQAAKPPAAWAEALRVCGFRIWAVKNSMTRRSAAGSGASGAGSRVVQSDPPAVRRRSCGKLADPAMRQRPFYMNDNVGDFKGLMQHFT